MRRRVLRWFVSFVLVGVGVVFGLPRLGQSQDVSRLGGAISPRPWDPAWLAPPADAVATRDLPLVEEGQEGQPGVVGAGSDGGFTSRTPDFDSGPGAERRVQVGSEGLKPRVKPKAGVRDAVLDAKGGDGLFSVDSPKAVKNSKAPKPAKVRFELLDDVSAKKLGVSGFLFKASRSDGGK
jgi:hypothetical protein